MATVAELKSALQGALESQGVLGQIKARLRAEVFRALEDPSEARPALCPENLLINELIREYLDFNRYRHTLSVLTAESGQPAVPLERDFLVKELNVVEGPSSRSIPLLYSLLLHFLNRSDGGKVFLTNPLEQPSPNRPTED